jgi:uncharacterized membrane protein
MHATIILLRILHILSALFWVGTLLFMTFYLFPTLATVGPAGDSVMAGLQKRGMLVALPVAGIVAILSGAGLMWAVSGGNFGAWASTSVGRAFSMAGGLAILAFLIGVIVARPTGEKMIQTSKAMNAATTSSERSALQATLTGLQKRLAATTISVAVLVLLAAAGMAVARYM